ncbi:MFS general substrate transporter [Hymenopellis radicata]|nr:MFS general substrate transporter [Hymenopellis radicata]
MDPSTPASQSSENHPPFDDVEKSTEKQETSVVADPPEVPDGGSAAWMTLVGAFLAVFCSSGYVNAYGVYEDFFVREYLSESSSFQITWIGSVQVLFLGCSGIPGGYAMDHGYFRWVTISGSLLLTFCLVMTSFCQEQQFWQMFLANGVGLGIAVGMLYVPALGVLSHHFKKRRSLMMGLAQAGSSVGGLVHPIMLNNLFHGRLGFAWGVRVSALFNLVLLIIANLLMTTRLPARPKDTTFKKQLVYWKSFFTDKVYVLATLSVFILYSGVYFPAFFLQLDAVESGLSESLAFYSLTLLNGVGVLGRIMPTIIVDRVGVFNMMIPCAFACGVMIFSWVAMKDAAGVISMAVFYGFFAGAVVSLVAPMIAYLTPNVSDIGARLGVSIGIGAVGALIGPPVCGALLTSQLLWVRPVIFSGICVVASAGTLTIAKLLSDRQTRRITAAS